MGHKSYANSKERAQMYEAAAKKREAAKPAAPANKARGTQNPNNLKAIIANRQAGKGK